MVREIHLTELQECKDKDYLGKFSKEGDYDEVIDHDCDVFLPDGTLVLCFRKQAIKSLVEITPERHEYWRWASLYSASVNRGDAAGTDLINDKGIRFTSGQYFFFSKAKKGEFDDATLEECMEFVESNTKWNVWNYSAKWVKADGLVDVEKVEKLEDEFRQSKSASSLSALISERGRWFRNWVETKFLKADDRRAEAKEGWRKYSGAQSWNWCSSNVVGAIDRQALVPWARLTGTTTADMEGFEREAPFFREADALFKELMPENHKYLYDKFQKVADPRYNLFDTAFTSVTINNNFRVAYHRDKLNCKGGIAIITGLVRGDYDGFGLIFPQMRLCFDIRHGDFLVGDNQGYIHGQAPMTNATPDAEAIWHVFYSKERLQFVDNLECEMCRRDFKKYAREHHQHRGNGKSSWGGVFQKMWSSPEWNEYKAVHCPEASNTNWCCTEDK